MIVFKNECPCRNCVHYIKGKQHPNPNAYDLHYCEVKQKPIIQHKGNAIHSNGQWILPCGGKQFRSKPI